VFVIDDEDDKLASALAKLAESAGPPWSSDASAHGRDLMAALLPGWSRKKTCRQEIFSI
jgi:hypothetical protein